MSTNDFGSSSPSDALARFAEAEGIVIPNEPTRTNGDEMSQGHNEIRDLKDTCPEQVADEILEPHTAGDIVTVRFWRGALWCWVSCMWREMTKGRFESWVNGLLRQRYRNLKKSFTENVRHNIATTTYLDDTVEPPMIISPNALAGTPAAQWDFRKAIFGQDGVLYLPWIQTRPQECFIPATAAIFNTTRVACNVNPLNIYPAPTRWLAFLHSIWGSDTEAIRSLQQWFGYLLTPDTTLQKILLIVGPARSGKGTIARVLHALHEGCTAGPTLASLSTQFGLSGLMDKSIAIISDARLPSRDTTVIAERLLSISGEDSLMIDRKYREPVNVKLPSRLVIMSNELPAIRDASNALSNRMIVLPMQRSFLGQENPNLFNELRGELDAIFWWAVQGRLDLQQQGRLLQPACGNEMVQGLADLGSPISAFVRECCIVGSDCTTTKARLFNTYKGWCIANGYHTPCLSVFFRNLNAALSGLSSARPTQDGMRVRTITGIALSPDATLYEGRSW